MEVDQAIFYHRDWRLNCYRCVCRQLHTASLKVQIFQMESLYKCVHLQSRVWPVVVLRIVDNDIMSTIFCLLRQPVVLRILRHPLFLRNTGDLHYFFHSHPSGVYHARHFACLPIPYVEF